MFYFLCIFDCGIEKFIIFVKLIVMIFTSTCFVELKKKLKIQNRKFCIFTLQLKKNVIMKKAIEFDNLPIEIQEKMLERQVEYAGKKDANVFRNSIMYGFAWEDTAEGHLFWYNILYKGKIEEFYKRYPKKDKPTYPCEMWVWDDDDSKAVKGTVVQEIKGRYLVFDDAKEYEDIEKYEFIDLVVFENASLENPNNNKRQQLIEDLEQKLQQLKKEL